MSELPANVESRKEKKPVHWSWPVQTMDLVNGLDLGSLFCPVGIYFSNRANNEQRSILSVFWRKRLQRFYIEINLCKPQNRQKLLKVFKETILPDLKNWLAGVKPEEPSLNYSLTYFSSPWRKGLTATVRRARPKKLLDKGQDRLRLEIDLSAMDRPQLKKILDRESDWLSVQPGVHSLGIQEDREEKLAIAIYCFPNIADGTKIEIARKLGDMTPIIWVLGGDPRLENNG